MKVLHISASYKPAFIYGGPVFCISALLESYVRYGVNGEIYTTTANGNDNLDVETDKTILVEGVPVRYYQRYLGGLFWAPQLMKAVWRNCKKFDVVHVHSWWNLVSVCSVMVCLLRGVTPVITLHGTMSEFAFTHNKTKLKNIFHWCIGRFLLAKSILHFASTGEYQNAAHWIRLKRYFVVKNIIQPISKLEASGAKSGEFTLVFIGRIHPVKNLELLIQAIQGLRIHCILKIYGEGDPIYERELRERSHPGVQWLGWINDTAKYQALRDADALVLLSRYENFGNVMVEALSQGTPVICAKGIGISDFVEEFDLGWTVEPQIDALRIALEDLYHNKEKSERIRNVAADCVARFFSPSVLVQQYFEQYQKYFHVPATAQLSKQQV